MVFSPTFGQPVSFMDPGRAEISIRLNLPASVQVLAALSRFLDRRGRA